MSAPKKSQTTVTQKTIDDVRRLQEDGNPFVVSYGMGVDSTAMLIGLFIEGLRPDLIVFADTGAEKSETYAFLTSMNTWLRSVGFPEITVVRYHPSAKRSTDPRTGQPYTDFVGKLIANSQLPSLSYKGHSCSITWKQDAIERFILGWKARGKANADLPSYPGWTPGIEALAAGKIIIKAIGYDCGAADMKRGNFCQKHEPQRYDYAYPLRWWGWTREDCKAVIADAGLPVPPKSSCYFCPAMKDHEVRDLAVSDPELLLQAIAIEDRAMSAGWAAYREAERTGFDAKGKPFDAKKTEAVRRGGLWTLMRPNTSCPTSWREFCEREGLLELAQATERKVA